MGKIITRIKVLAVVDLAAEARMWGGEARLAPGRLAKGMRGGLVLPINRPIRHMVVVAVWASLAIRARCRLLGMVVMDVFVTSVEL